MGNKTGVSIGVGGQIAEHVGFTFRGFQRTDELRENVVRRRFFGSGFEAIDVGVVDRRQLSQFPEGQASFFAQILSAKIPGRFGPSSVLDKQDITNYVLSNQSTNSVKAHISRLSIAIVPDLFVARVDKDKLALCLVDCKGSSVASASSSSLTEGQQVRGRAGLNVIRAEGGRELQIERSSNEQ